MTSTLLRHVFESTLLCIMFGFLTLCLRRQPATMRHSFWMLSILKFAIPTTLLAATGAWVAVVIPATDGALAAAARLSSFLSKLPGFWPLHTAARAIASPIALSCIWALGSAAMFAIWVPRIKKGTHAFSAPTNAELAALERSKKRLRFWRSIGLRYSAEKVVSQLYLVFSAR
jgi:hypothetical protein